MWTYRIYFDMNGDMLLKPYKADKNFQKGNWFDIIYEINK